MLIEDAALRQTVGQTGQAMVERDFTLATHAPRLTKVLRAAANATTESMPR